MQPPIYERLNMDEKTIIYALAAAIAALTGYIVKKQHETEKTIERRIMDKEKENQRVTEELRLLREWKDTLYEKAIQKRLKNNSDH